MGTLLSINAKNQGNGEGPYPARLLGMGIWAAWACCVHGLALFLPIDGRAGSFAPWFYLDALMRLGIIGVVVACCFLREVLERPSPWFRFLTFGACAGIGGTIGLWVFSRGIGSQFAAMLLALVASILVGVGRCVLFLGWSVVYVQLGPRDLMVAAALSLACAGVVGLMVLHLDNDSFWLSLFGMPALSALLLRASLFDGGGGCTGLSASAPPSAVWRPAALLGCAAFANGFFTYAIPSSPAYLRLGALATVGLISAVIHAVLRAADDGSRVPSALLGLGCMLLLLVINTGRALAFPMAWLCSLAWGFACFLVLASMACEARNRGFSPLETLGPVYATGIAMGFMGACTEFVPRALGFALPPAVGLVSVALGLCSVALLGLKVAEGVRDLSEPCAPVDAEEPYRLPLGAQDRFGLTERELEVLVGLMGNKSYEQISRELTLSMNTVKSHAHRIYQKLGVHTRRQARDLIEDGWESSHFGGHSL